MKLFVFPLLLLLSAIFADGLKAQAHVRYQVIVQTDSIGSQRGELQHVDGNGLTLKNREGELTKIHAGNIVRVSVFKKYLSFGKAILVGTVSGAAIGSTVFISNLNNYAQVATMLMATSVGIVAGTIYGLGSRLFLKELKLYIRKDVDSFKREHNRLSPFVIAPHETVSL